MGLEEKIMLDIKAAMLAKNTLRLSVCRSIKSALLLVKTERKSKELTEEKELEILQKLLKQRKEAAEIYKVQSRLDLAKYESDQASIILEYLPKPYSTEELVQIIDALISQLGIKSKNDIGKLISAVIKESKGRADGKTISDLVKARL